MVFRLLLFGPGGSLHIRILHRPPVGDVDGLDLSRFEPGAEYELGTAVGSLLLAAGWAEPVTDRTAGRIEAVDPDAFERLVDRRVDTPENLVREQYPPFADEAAAVASDFERRVSRSRSGQ